MAENTREDSPSIFEAVVRSDVAAIGDLLSSGLNIHAKDSFGRTALHLAIISASADVVQYLLDHGADVGVWTKQGEATLHLAAVRGDVEVFKTVMRAVESTQSSEGEKEAKGLNVDCLMKKRQISALQIAVALAHVNLVEVLLSAYNANANLPVGPKNPHQPLATMTSLWLALQHPRDSCRALVKLLLQHGVSLVDKTTGNVEMGVVQLILIRKLDTFDLFEEYDTESLRHVFTKLVWKQFSLCDSPLTMAIRFGFEAVAEQLLDYGAPAQLTIDSSVDCKIIGLGFPLKTPQEMAQERFWQPILLAAEYEMPKLIFKLLELGADPLVKLDQEQAREMTSHSDCRTVLDIVLMKLAEYQAWRSEDEHVDYRIKGTEEETVQRTGKENAIRELTEGYEKVKEQLIELGVQMTENLNLQRPEEEGPKRKKQQFGFNSAQQIPIPLRSLDSTDSSSLVPAELTSVEVGCSALFKACQENNLATIKALTLASWGVDSKFPPLTIAEKHNRPNTPYLTAVLNKHFDLARTIVFIAAAQHENHKTQDKILGEDILSVLTDDTYPPESITKLSEEVKCSVSPKQVVTELQNVFEVEKVKDIEMYRFVMSLESAFPLEQSDVERRMRHAWNLVERGEWSEGLDTYIRTTGAPFKHATVRGTLEVRTQLDRLYQMTPMLHAARSGNLTMVKYFLEPEKPLEAYKEFAANNQFDQRKGGADQAKERFLDTTNKWLNQRTNLVLHSAITSGKIELVKYLISARPDLLEIKSYDGWTPLLVAACLENADMLQFILDAGADTSAKDNKQRNMLHLLFCHPGEGCGWVDSDKLCVFYRSLDQSLRDRLLHQRCTDSPGELTPFARWLHALKEIGYVAPEAGDLFKTVLELSDASMMEIFDATGSTPLHIVTRHSLEKLIEPLTEKAPHVFLFEGAGGKTPLDWARERHIETLVEGISSEYARDKSYSFPRAGQTVHHPLWSFSPTYGGPTRTRDQYTAWEIAEKLVNEMDPKPPRKLASKELADASANKPKNKKQKQYKGNESDEISLAIFKPGNLY